MAEIVRMPKLSDTMTEGVVAAWHKKIGDKVSSGELLAEIETDKATMEFESFQDGYLLYIGVEKGKAAPVNSILAILGNQGEDVSKLVEEEKKIQKTEDRIQKTEEKKSEPKKEISSPLGRSGGAEKTPQPAVQSQIPNPKSQIPNSSDGRLKASPLAKKLAEEKGINISNVKGSGDFGRVVKRDVETYTPFASASSTFVGVESYSEEPVSQMRKTIARRLAESKFSAPHFYLTIEIDMDEVVKARPIINTVTSVKISFNDIVIKAVAAALRKHPKVNSSWQGDTIRYNEHINIGVAMAVEEGLLVPVVRFADGKTLSQIATEVKEYGQKAKDKKLQSADWEGNTFTISNLGMFGIEEFTAIINPPDACIMAVGAIKQTPVVKNNSMQIGSVMKVTLSCDHRVVDGAKGAAFLQTFKQLMENPVLLLGAREI